MDSATKTRIEYEHQYFHFSSDSIIDSFKDLLKDTCESSIGSLVKMLKKKLLPAAANPKEVEEALDQMGESLKGQYHHGADYGISTVEAQIRECFRIPDNALLPEDRIIETVENMDEDGLNAEIDQLKQELKNIAFLTEEVKEEITIADMTMQVLKEATSIQV